MLHHQRDLAADFRAFYHLSPAEALNLPAPEYLALAYRCSAYQGVMQARLAEAEAETRRNQPRRGARRVEGTRTAVMADPLLAAAISFN